MGFIIPVYNTEPRVLEETVRDLRSQSLLPIYIVNDGSTLGDTLELLRRLESEGLAEVIHQENRGKIAALRTGVREGNLVYAFLIDDDVSIRKNDEYASKPLDDVLAEEASRLSQPDSGVCVVYPVGARNRDKSVLTRVQHVEHLIPTYFARKFMGSGLYIGGSGSLWMAREFLELTEFHSGVHEGDDLEITLIVQGSGKNVLFSDRLILLADMKDDLKSWFKQRLSWEYGKWRLLPRFWREILMHSHVNVYYFASPILIASLFFRYAPFLYVATLIPAILAPKQYSRTPRDKLKELTLHIPWIGLFSAVYNPILLAAPLPLITVVEALKKTDKRNGLLEEIKLLDLLQYFAYTLLYLAVVQPAGAVYTMIRLLGNRTRNHASPTSTMQSRWHFYSG